MLRETFEHISANYLEAIKEPMAKHPLAEYIRHSAVRSIKEALGSANDDMIVKGGLGQFNTWATVPWVGIFNPIVTTGAQYGYYPVYLFSADMRSLYLSLNQGVTALEKEFKNSDLIDNELKIRARRMLSRVRNDAIGFNDASIDLRSDQKTPKRYCSGHSLGKSYDLLDLPSESQLLNDLLMIVRLYRMLTARGGTSIIIDADDDEPNSKSTYMEKKQYRYHRRIERNNGKLIAEVKRLHQKQCEGCSFDFGLTYGLFAEGYIEAHHLTPFAELPEDKPVPVDPVKDFAVLCANCHRMMHKKNGPKTVGELIKTINQSC